ncbi:hypothetical protein ABL840_18875 [Variovorax sp. NFACC27]|jgi:hypothetical protein|uniref:hypothetical protein n=1 Tax=unclassified Variovorax TaxID=663243 RepID=UPI00115F9601
MKERLGVSESAEEFEHYTEAIKHLLAEMSVKQDWEGLPRRRYSYPTAEIETIMPCNKMLVICVKTRLDRYRICPPSSVHALRHGTRYSGSKQLIAWWYCMLNFGPSADS